jgi:hypothetical protein
VTGFAVVTGGSGFIGSNLGIRRLKPEASHFEGRHGEGVSEVLRFRLGLSLNRSSMGGC